MKKSLFFTICLAFLSGSIAGCGYTTRSAIVTAYKTVYVERFKNKIDYTSEFSEGRKIKTYYPLIETNITTAVVDRFLFDGNLKIAKAENADVILRGELLDYIRDVLRYDDSNNPQEYRVSLVVRLILWDPKEDKPIWEEKRFIGDSTYFVSGSLAKSESSAINDAVTDLARRIVERTVEQW